MIREGTEGAYAGAGGFLRKDTPHEIATEESVNTAFGVERVVRDAFARAPPARGTSSRWCTRTTCSCNPGDLWTRTVKAVGGRLPDIAVDYCHVDAATIYFVDRPAALSTSSSPTTCSATS